MKKILTIAGYDPSSGAGITRDLDVFFSLGLHGLSVPTAAVIQGPGGVDGLVPTPLQHFASMLEIAGRGIELGAVKIGVAWDKPYCREIVSFLGRRGALPVVIDPVSHAKNGTPLLTDEGMASLVGSLFPLAAVVTPNIAEASAITGMEITGEEDMKGAARVLHGMGPQSVVIKGGHLQGEPVDLLFDGDSYVFHRKRRVSRTVHGTGCMFSSAMASFLAMGYPVGESFFATQDFMESMLVAGYRIDEEGYHYSSSGILAARGSDRMHVVTSLKEAGERFMQLDMADLIPAVQLNMGYGTRDAGGIEDVAAFPGRIGHVRGQAVMKGEPCFGASSHVARMILAFMRFYPFIRSAANIRFSPLVIERALGKGLSAVRADRGEDSGRTGTEGGEGFDPLVETTLKNTKTPPDIIYDTGFAGLEPMIRLFARTPGELIKKMEIIGR